MTAFFVFDWACRQSSGLYLDVRGHNELGAGNIVLNVFEGVQKETRLLVATSTAFEASTKLVLVDRVGVVTWTGRGGIAESRSDQHATKVVLF